MWASATWASRQDHGLDWVLLSENKDWTDRHRGRVHGAHRPSPSPLYDNKISLDYFYSSGTGTTIRHRNQPRVLAPGIRVLRGGTGGAG